MGDTQRLTAEACASDPSFSEERARSAAALSLPSLRRQFLLAAAKGDTMLLKELVESGAEVDARNLEGETALMVAAYHGNVEAAVVLLDDLGASPTLVDDTDYSALMYAAAAGHLNICSAICEPGKRRARIVRAIYSVPVGLGGFLAGQVAEFLCAQPRPDKGLKKAIEVAELHSHQTVAEYLRARKFKARARNLLRNNRLKRRGVRSWPGPAHLWRDRPLAMRKRRSVSDGDLAKSPRQNEEDVLPPRPSLTARDILQKNRKKFRSSTYFPCPKFSKARMNKGRRKIASAPAGPAMGVLGPLRSASAGPSPMPSPRRARSAMVRFRSEESVVEDGSLSDTGVARTASDLSMASTFTDDTYRSDLPGPLDYARTTSTAYLLGTSSDDVFFNNFCNLVTAGFRGDDGGPMDSESSDEDVKFMLPRTQTFPLGIPGARGESLVPARSFPGVGGVQGQPERSRCLSAVPEDPQEERFSLTSAGTSLDGLTGRLSLVDGMRRRMTSLAVEETDSGSDAEGLLTSDGPDLIAVSAPI